MTGRKFTSILAGLLFVEMVSATAAQEIAAIAAYQSTIGPGEAGRTPDEFLDPLAIMMNRVGIHRFDKALSRDRVDDLRALHGRDRRPIILVEVRHLPGRGYQLFFVSLAADQNGPGVSADSYRAVDEFYSIISDDLVAGLAELEEVVENRLPVLVERLRAGGVEQMVLAECVLAPAAFDPAGALVDPLAEDVWVHNINIHFFRELQRSGLAARHRIFEVPTRRIPRFCRSLDDFPRHSFDVVISPTLLAGSSPGADVEVLFDIQRGDREISYGEVSIERAAMPRQQARALVDAIESDPIWSAEP